MKLFLLFFLISFHFFISFSLRAFFLPISSEGDIASGGVLRSTVLVRQLFWDLMSVATKLYCYCKLTLRSSWQPCPWSPTEMQCVCVLGLSEGTGINVWSQQYRFFWLPCLYNIMSAVLKKVENHLWRAYMELFADKNIVIHKASASLGHSLSVDSSMLQDSSGLGMS